MNPKKPSMWKCTWPNCTHKPAKANNLMKHAMTKKHLNMLSYMCHICGKRYNSNSNLTSHIKIEHEARIETAVDNSTSQDEDADVRRRKRYRISPVSSEEDADTATFVDYIGYGTYVCSRYGYNQTDDHAHHHDM